MHRRIFLGAGLALGAAAQVRAAEHIVTAQQVEGPFYNYDPPKVHDTDLVRLLAGDAPAVGQVTHVFGTAQSWGGQPVKNALIEIWQCDANGRYHHPDDHEQRPLDARFQGYGRTMTDASGGFRFRTIRPVAYAIGNGEMRTPHIHLALSTRGVRRLTTQLYVEGEALNEKDSEIAKLLPVQRSGLIRPFTDGSAIEAGAQTVRYDLILV
jgi:protocatechuate 3,4-dioxygenase, beta subunit